MSISYEEREPESSPSPTTIQRLETLAETALEKAERAMACGDLREGSSALMVLRLAKREIEAMRPSASPWNAGFAAAQAGLDAIRPTISLRLVPEPHRSRIIADAVTHSTSEEAREAENVGSVCGKGAPFCQVVTPRGELRDESGRPISAEDEAKIRHECPRCPRRGGIVPPLEGEPSRAEGAGGARQTIAASLSPLAQDIVEAVDARIAHHMKGLPAAWFEHLAAAGHDGEGPWKGWK